MRTMLQVNFIPLDDFILLLGNCSYSSLSCLEHSSTHKNTIETRAICTMKTSDSSVDIVMSLEHYNPSELALRSVSKIRLVVRFH